MKTRRITWLLVGALGLSLGFACSSNSGNTVASGGGHNLGGAGGSGATSAGGSGADGGVDLDASTQNFASLAVSPASATIDVVGGKSSPATFKAVATYKDGSTATVAATWSFDRLDLATIAQSGTLTANNAKGGKGTVTAKVGKLSATADVVIQLHLDDNSGGLSQGDQNKFNSPDGNPSGTLLYPYDQTVFARGILAPEMMWSGGAAGDAYKVSIVDSYVTLTAFIKADPPSRWTMPKAWWEALTTSNDGSPVSVKVQRLDGAGAAHAAMSETWQIAQGSLRGTIYYWAVNQGQIVKINPGADHPVPAFDPGPYNQLGSPAPVSGYNNQSPPWQATGSGHRCVACHTVSKDGSTIAAVFSAPAPVGGSSGPWGTVDSTTEQVKALGDYTAKVRFMALTPDGKYIVSNSDGFTHGARRLRHRPDHALRAGRQDRHGRPAVLAGRQAAGLLGQRRRQLPGRVHAGGSAGDGRQHDGGALLHQPPHNRRRRHPGDRLPELHARLEVGRLPARRLQPRALRSSNGVNTGHNDLYMADVAKQVGELKLDLANGAGVLGPKDSQRNYEPRVNPISVGGYYWVVFVSPRDYGNEMQSATDSTTQNRKQLWVAAIDANPTAGKDPSHPAFWLPGQSLSTINMDAYWALEACKQQGKSCDQGYQCCSGFCRDQGNGTYACVAPPTNQCAQIGEACKTAADCCTSSGPVDCVGGFCALKGPA